MKKMTLAVLVISMFCLSAIISCKKAEQPQPAEEVKVAPAEQAKEAPADKAKAPADKAKTLVDKAKSAADKLKK